MDTPHIESVMGEVAATVRDVWAEVASQYSDTGNYAGYLNASDAIVSPWENDHLAVAVVNRSPHAAVLETGHGGFHLPSVIDWAGSPKVKTAKSGKRYLSIPFRNMTPSKAGAGTSTTHKRREMPEEVYRDARAAFAKDKAARLPDTGQYRVSRHYGLMEKQIPTFPKGLRARAEAQEGHPGYTQRAGRYAGMFRSEQKSPSGLSSGVYMTIRTMTEDSVGWYIPPFGGHHIAEQAAAQAIPILRELVAAAATEDVAAMVKQAVGF